LLNKTLRYGLLAFAVFFCRPAMAQNYKVIDSLKDCLRKTMPDSSVADTYEELFWEYYGVYNDSALYFAKKLVDYSEKRAYVKGKANGYRMTGMAYAVISNYTDALRFEQMALKACEKTKDMGMKANILNNLANIYYEVKEYHEALSYQERSLDLCLKLNLKRGVSACFGNMGNIYKNLGNTRSALKYYEKSIAIDRELHNALGYANSWGNIGSLYFARKEYARALDYFNRSLHVRDSLGNTNGITSSYISMANVYDVLGQTKTAMDYYKKALSLAEESGTLDQQESCYQGLYHCYKKTGEVDEALAAYEKGNQLKDSMLNSSRLDELNQLKTKYLLEQQESEQKIKIAAVEAKKDTEKAAAEKQGRIILVSAIIGIILMLIFSYLIYKRYTLSLRQQHIIQSQKKIVEVKNQEITDSINYAKRIQEALLTSEQEFCSHFQNAFVLFKPKDIVSGDFYWVSSIPNTSTVVFALGDCTGHGVPGGFMSVLGMNLLNEIVNEKQVTEPAEVLELLRVRIIAALKQDGNEGNSRDGMDVTVCKLDRTTGAFAYAMANRMLYVHSGGELTRYTGDRMPVSFYEKEAKFSQNSLQLRKGDLIYLFTDGFTDQVGGPEGRKFKYPNFETAIKTAIADSRPVDKKYFNEIFLSWKKERHQVDDVSLIGVEV
jgi:serine phosphatase RsbU (regulator of sigma subunit)/Tfp pilus assembly protein PilF